MRSYGIRLAMLALTLGVGVHAGCSKSRDASSERRAGAAGSSRVTGAGGAPSRSSDITKTPPTSRPDGGIPVSPVAGAGAADSAAAGGNGAATATNDACPPYQSSCGGKCLATSQDPQNCGACGVVCRAGEACSAGVCATTCTTSPAGGSTPITKCGQSCVDLFNDNENCGACGTSCSRSNQVCAGGRCVAKTVPLNDTAKACPNGGPPIRIDAASIKTCAGTLAQTTFRWGLCSCGPVSLVNSGESWKGHPGLDFPALYIDAYDSSKGPWNPDNPQLGGSLGVNGTFTSKSGAFTFLTGHMWGASSITTGGRTDVKQELHALGSITSAAAFYVGQPNSSSPAPTVPVMSADASWDGYVAGSINASAPMTFYKDLHLQSAASPPQNVVVQGKLDNASVMFPPPCDSCGDSQIPVAAIVDHYAAAANNDNATIGLAPGALARATGTTRLDLPCGSYFLDSIDAQGSVTIYAHGHTALFIGGNVNADVLSFTLDPTGSFDVFVKGTIKTQADLIIGNPNYAALSRTYVAGAGLSLDGEAHIAGLFYAANTDLKLQSHLTVYGALYCKSFSGSGDNTDIHYDRAALKVDRGCCGDVDFPDAPGCGKTCVSCKDCGNQACVSGACSPCTSNAQCCAPLICYQGTCMAALD